jgi:hypothetical protein
VTALLIDSTLRSWHARQVLEMPRGSHKLRLLFASTSDGPRGLLLFHHIPKTAGTSLMEVVLEYLSVYEEVDITLDLVPRAQRDHMDMGKWFAEAYADLGKEHQRRLRFATGHQAIHFLPLLKSSDYAITVVREAVDRTLSRYHFANRPENAEPRRGTTGPTNALLRSAPLVELLTTYGGGGPTTSPEHRALDTLFNGQSRTLLAPFFDVSELGYSRGRAPDAALWRKRLFSVARRFSLVGVTDRFDDSVRLLSQDLQWLWVPRSPESKKNVNRPRVAELPEEVVRDVAAYNWLDAELYSWASTTLQARLSGSPGARARRVG